MKVGGRKGVRLAVDVDVIVKVALAVGVYVIVLVTMDGVGLPVGDGVTSAVLVKVAVGVMLPGWGANKTATPPSK